MTFSRSDLLQLKALQLFLMTSFQGASVGRLLMNDAMASLDRAVTLLEQLPSE